MSGTPPPPSRQYTSSYLDDDDNRFKEPHSSEGSGTDEDYADSANRTPPSSAVWADERYASHLHAKVSGQCGVNELEEDERVSSSVVENPEELAEGDFDDVVADDKDGSIGSSSSNSNSIGSHKGQVSDEEGLVAAGAGAAGPSQSMGPSVTAVAVVDGVPDPASLSVDTVGLVNEGCTCYLNSLLQLLFHLSYLRSAVYRIPAEDNGDANVNTVYKALQELFFQMQERTTPGRTKKLTDAFGWGEQELFVQHDIQEMATLLRDNLEERMKGTVTEGAITQLFEGRGEQFVETLDKTYVSRSKDIFYDIHIPLSEHTNLLDSIRSLTQRDQLVGDNKYKVEQEGKKPVYKDAEKGYEYIKFPPVTWFHLKRFAMDLTSPTLEMKKVNSRMEFPLVLDLRELEKGLSPEQQRKMRSSEKLGAAVEPFTTDSPAIYDLQGVIVHRGTVRSGHYYCYIRDWDPKRRCFTRWIEFEDENVRVVPEEVAVSANYGGPTGRGGYYNREPPMNNANAYILSYVRRADAPTLLAPSPTDIITQRVKDAMRREMEEEERRTKLELAQNACLLLYVVTDEGLAAHCEHSQSELFPRDSRTARNYVACVVEVRKSDTIATAYEAIAAEPSMVRRGVTATNCRLWRWTNTRGFRPTTALPTAEQCNRSPALLSDYLTANELDRPLCLCIYVQESVMYLLSSLPMPPAADLHPLVRRMTYDSGRSTFSIQLKAPTRVHGLVLTVDAPYVHTCKVQYIITNEVNEELPVGIFRGPVTEGVVHVPIDSDALATSILLQCASTSDLLAVTEGHVQVQPWDMPPALAASHAAAHAEVSRLPRAGPDRVLLLLKWFDHVSGTVKYVGAVLVDRSATLASLEPMWYLLMGLPFPPRLLALATRKASTPPPHRVGGGGGGGGGGGEEPRQPAGAARQPPPVVLPPCGFVFFEEGKGMITREISPTVDLWAGGLHGGSVVVAQSLEVPTAYRHAHVETYYRTLQSTVDLRVLEVATRTRANAEEYSRCIAEHKRLAARLKEEEKEKDKSELKASGDCGGGQQQPTATGSPPSLQSPTTASLPASGKTSAPGLPTVLADPSLDPFNTTLPVLHQPVLEVVGNGVAKMPSQWLYETACDCFATAVRADPSYLRLYRSTSATEPAPAQHPVRDVHEATVEDVIAIDAYTVSPVIFYERLAVPRAQLEQLLPLTMTLRDAAGHALHREAYTLAARETLQGLVRLVRRSLDPQQQQGGQEQTQPIEDPWGSLRATLMARHFVLLAVDKRRSLIRLIVEVPMADATVAGAVVEMAETRVEAALTEYNLVIMPAPPLRVGEQRIACCHGDYRQVDAHIFGHPFTITVHQQTTVRDSQALMCAVTHVPPAALNAQRETGKDYGVMMYTDVPLHFANWGEYVARFWVHTLNHSGFIPNLLLNHPSPKEKPGSRYVAQHNPQLKIAKN